MREAARGSVLACAFDDETLQAGSSPHIGNVMGWVPADIFPAREWYCRV